MHKLSSVAVGLAVRRAREQAELRANELAQMIGLTPSSLSRVENGTRALDFAEATAIATVTGVTLDQLAMTATRLDSSQLVRDRQRNLDELKESLLATRDAAKAALQQMQ